MSASTTRRRAAAAAGVLASTLAGALWSASAQAADLLGQPTPGAIDMQPGASALRHQAAFFHNWIVSPIIVAISAFVLLLLAIVVVRYNARANPVPDKFTHNTAIEIVWTIVPVLILMFISIFSFRLLYTYHDMPKPDVTVKVTGNQWYWTYEYPEAGGYSFDSLPLKEAEAEAKGKGLYRLAVDKPMVVPVGATVQVLATGADVLHAFFVPAFGIQETTIPGRINQTWFKPEKEGVFYGQCNELCGVNHSFMPIEIDVVSPAAYKTWIASHAKPGPSTSPAAAAPVPTAEATAAAKPGDATSGPAVGASPPTPSPGAAPPAAQTGPLGADKAPATAATRGAKA